MVRNLTKFQGVIDNTLLGVKGVKNFLDDIIMTGRNEEEHIVNLREVFKTLESVGFTLNKKKCIFFQLKIQYLGHIFGVKSIKKYMSKIEAILKAKEPTNVTQVKIYRYWNDKLLGQIYT